MKTFAYAALIASAMAVRLMEVEEVAAEAPVEDAATMDDLADLTLGDLEGEQEGLGECFLHKTGEALADRSMDEDEIMELGEELVAGAEAGEKFAHVLWVVLFAHEAARALDSAAHLWIRLGLSPVQAYRVPRTYYLAEKGCTENAQLAVHCM